MPLPPRSPEEVNWFLRTFFDAFADPVGLPAAGLGAAAFMLGIVAMWRRDAWLLALWLLPFGVALIASRARMYPFTSRFLLFGVPLITPVIAEGLDFLRTHATTKLVYACTVAVVLAQPAVAGVKTVVRGNADDGIRPAFGYLKDNARPGDVVYLEHWAIFPFQYYEKRNGAAPGVQCVYGAPSRDDWGYFRNEIHALRGRPRVWFVFTASPKSLVGEEEKFFAATLDAEGKRLDARRFQGSSAYLYDLTPTANPTARACSPRSRGSVSISQAGFLSRVPGRAFAPKASTP
jgi:hypothetical protein